MRHGRRGNPWWHNRFEAEGVRLTMPRRVILDVLSRNTGHLSAEEIYLIIHRVYPGIGFATVYRTLDLLTSMGMVLKFDFGDGRARYEIAHGETEPHYHLVCSSCGKVENRRMTEEEKGYLNRMRGDVSHKNDFSVDNVKIHFIGTCGDCRENGAPSTQEGGE